ncbi:MAG TPA: hypothetical protein VME43_23605 [Bryobacteraceae bacterium]|nr:hypothetical protein [Bryobacteraceae bacterium]
MFSPAIFWPGFAGLMALIAGLVAYRGEFARARGWDKLAVWGPAFVATGIAVFGCVHFAQASGVMQIVPAFLPFRLFWTYFVAVALLSAALSIVTKKYVRLSATLLGAMFLLFVLMIHLPNVVLAPKNRFVWAVMMRDLSFGAGAWAISREKPGGAPAVAARFVVGAAALFFGVEQLLHPGFRPGVPLRQLTPAWIPWAPLWGYVTGGVLLVAGAAMLMGKRSRGPAAIAGAAVALGALCIDVPVFARAARPEMADELNVWADTLLYAGAVLCAARVLPGKKDGDG